ncbi:hypothetical protein OG741_01305 [Streptomyces sp. NBC_01410]|uniref:hypothetical protein n=1 Tax=Streptomyces sp. NBC_01410 TaxID=2903856 RepID=UPI00324C0DEF
MPIIALLLLLLLVLFLTAFRYTLKVTRIRDIPPWRRYLPLALLLIATAASLQRAVDNPEVANMIAFPLNIAAVGLSLREIRNYQARTTTSQPA